MDSGEFEKIWRLLQSLWPSTAAKKSKNDIAVWRRGLEAYPMDEVTDRIMEYARKNKFFPDLADVTGKLLEGNDGNVDEVMIRTANLIARMKKMEPPEFRTGRDALEWYRGLGVSE